MPIYAVLNSTGGFREWRDLENPIFKPGRLLSGIDTGKPYVDTATQNVVELYPFFQSGYAYRVWDIVDLTPEQIELQSPLNTNTGLAARVNVLHNRTIPFIPVENVVYNNGTLFGKKGLGVVLNNDSFILGPSLGTSSIQCILPSATTAQSLIGNTAANQGTLSTVPDQILGNATQYTSPAISFSAAGTSTTTASIYRGTTSGIGNGFLFISKFALLNPPAAYITSGIRFFCGLTSQTFVNAVAATDPAGSRVGLSFVRATGGSSAGRVDTTWKISSKNGSETLTDTSETFSSGYYIFSLYCGAYPNNNVIRWRLQNIMENTSVSGTISDTLPVGSAAMRMGCYLNNVSGVKIMKTSLLYCEV